MLPGTTHALTYGLAFCSCGAMQFVVPQSEDNKPRNILEEIVW